MDKLLLLHFLFFIIFLVSLWILEFFFPLRKKLYPTKKRWFHNFSISIINSIIIRFLLFITPISVWIYVWEKWLWLFNILSLNIYLEIIISIVLLDLIIYTQHILSHKIKWFWKLHSIHHSDKTLDITTSFRFHTLEIIISAIIKMFFVFILWINPISVIIFEIILSSWAIISHSNLKLPKKLDKILSYLFVTPEFHQVHHSILKKEHHSNFWFFLSIWDKVFNTYTYYKFKVKEIWLKENKKDFSLKDLLFLKINK